MSVPVLLRRWYELILEHHRDLAVLMTLEQGKPLAEAQGEVLHGASYVEWFAEEAKRIYGDTMPMAQKGESVLLCSKNPMGVCAAITPWNFPSQMVTRKASPAPGGRLSCRAEARRLGLHFQHWPLLFWPMQAGFPQGVL